MKQQYWFCVIGPVDKREFPKNYNGFDSPPRKAAITAIEEYGVKVENCWSGWGVTEFQKDKILEASQMAGGDSND